MAEIININRFIKILNLIIKLQKKEYKEFKKTNSNIEYLILLEGKNSIKEALKNHVKIPVVFVDKSKLNSTDFKEIKKFLFSVDLRNKDNNKFTFEFNIFQSRVLKGKIDYTDLSYLNKFLTLNKKILPVEKNNLLKLSSTKTPYPFIGIGLLPEKFKNNLDLKIKDNLILLDNIQDPGNLGTIIRSSVAFGFNTIFLSGKTVFPFYSKVIRSSAGLIFYLDHISIIQYNFLNYLKDKGYKFIGLSPHSKYDIYSTFNNNNLKKIVFCFGNEGKGISNNLKKYIDFSVKIPIESHVESLNLSISVALVEYIYYLKLIN